MTQDVLAGATGALDASAQWGALAPETAPVAAFRALLQATATYAWLGSDATLLAWPDVVAGINAAAGGSGTTLGALNGRVCPVLNGSGYYQSAAFPAPIAQPHAVVIACRNDGSGSGERSLIDGRDATNRAQTGTDLGQFYLFAGVTLRAGAFGASPYVIRATVNGAASSISANGVIAAAGAAGSQSWAGLTIGARYSTAEYRWIGPIALIAAVAGDDYAARAAAIAAAARAHYKI